MYEIYSISLVEYLNLIDILFKYLSYIYMVIFMKIKEGILYDNNIKLESLEVSLNNTTLLILEGYNAFAMCGALDCSVYNTPKMLPRNVVCMRAMGVKTLEELYNAEIYEASIAANKLNIIKGLRVCDAFEILSKK